MNKSMIQKVFALTMAFKKLSKIRGNFEFNYFKSLTDPQEILEYCEEILETIAQGSSRKVFIFTSRFAIKVAMNPAGKLQNHKEFKLSNSTKYTDFIAKTYYHEDNF